MSKRPLIKEFLNLLDIVGLNPTHEGLLTKVKGTATTVLLSLLVIEFVLRIALTFEQSNSVEVCMVGCSAIQVLHMIATMLLKKGDFVLFFNIIEKFWCWDNLESNLKHNFKAITKATIQYAKLFGAILSTTMTAFCLRTVFTDGRLLPFDTYHPTDRSKTLNYTLAYLLQVFITVVAGIVITGFDGLFISFVIHIVCELKAIKQRLKTIDVSDCRFGEQECCLAEINLLIEHHDLVLSCIKSMDSIYAGFFLIQFADSVILICSGLIFVVASGFPPDLDNFFRYALFLPCVTALLFIFCLAGTYIISETEDVSAAIYDSDWYTKTQPKFRRACAMIIQRANKTECLTAGGMFVVNLETFTKVLKFSFSFFSLTQAMYSNDDQR